MLYKILLSLQTFQNMIDVKNTIQDIFYIHLHFLLIVISVITN